MDLENAIVVDRDKILNEGGLRNERILNHKILDLVGVLLSEHEFWKNNLQSRRSRIN